MRTTQGLPGHRQTRGLSLLETLLATFMFVTVMISLMDVWVAHSRAFDKTQGQEVGSFLCQRVMEQTLSSGYNVVPAGVFPPATGWVMPQAPPFIVQRTMRGVAENAWFLHGCHPRLDPYN